MCCTTVLVASRIVDKFLFLPLFWPKSYKTLSNDWMVLFLDVINTTIALHQRTTIMYKVKLKFTQKEEEGVEMVLLFVPTR